MKGKWQGDEYTLRSRYFGKYTLVIDSIAPKIRPVNIGANKDMSSYNTFSLKISDDLSGIAYYRGEIDGEWILMEYDAKKDLLTYRFDNDRVSKGKKHFTLVVKDQMGNKKKYEIDFIR